MKLVIRIFALTVVIAGLSAAATSKANVVVPSHLAASSPAPMSVPYPGPGNCHAFTCR